ncbi:type 1 glutamine amidotransferase domain-containing protein [Sediminispirochaeta bajacaliforniensis]|uniref:type 1 glutamine amidotransferase domain-containing protein n=1 Tax=Sediminispirochaeta bajacaliforniensis TaxID=148 RepID=UPI00036A5075|nr:type 1 glutamine amidotransferase domain-containing protein [Sediminispirochaeta bajacaliforniensis]
MLHVVSLVHDQFEDLELWYPVLRLREAGASVLLAGEKAEAEYHGKYGVPARADISFDEVDPDSIDALLVPGGWAPDKLRRFPKVLDAVRAMFRQEKVVGQICHAGWVLVSAGVLNGYRVTSTPGIRDDMTNAGAVWLDEPVVVDRNLVSSRRPPDLPDYLKALVKLLQEKTVR